MKKIQKLCLMGLVCMTMFLSGCDDEETVDSVGVTLTETTQSGTVGEREDKETGENTSTSYSADDTWAVYWYLCGSDLESEYGAATYDIDEMLEVQLPENVKVIIQTGGANEWQNDIVDASKLQRFEYNYDGLYLIEEQDNANMGNSSTLEDFLYFCETEYPADHTAIIFWNHGGGSVTGVAFDENYDYDSLTLNEMYTAFENVYELSIEDPPFELIGFDTCLMATIDTAYTFWDIGKYLVASEEVEPGCGWNYTGWLNALAENPEMNGEQLGIAICDSYYEGCEDEWAEDEVTLSVTNLQKLENLIMAYDNLGGEALSLACENSRFFSRFGKAAVQSESYGGNNREEGYTNMVDLGHLVRNSADLLPEYSQAVLDGLEECVVYQVKGPYREEATGLSCYYSYSGNTQDFADYVNVGASEAFIYLYDYEFMGYLSSEGENYINELGYEDIEAQEFVAEEEYADLEDYPLYVEDGCAVLDIGFEAADSLQAVYYQLSYYNEDDDIILLLGRDDDIFADWENGIFRDNFRGVWGSIDDYLVYMEITYQGDGYNLYSVPILLNGEECNLRVAYNFDEGEYEIIGARQGIDDYGMADKNLIHLESGDEISTLHYAMTISGDDDEPMQVPVDTFIVTEDTSFYETDMGDGEFIIFYEMVGMANETYYSDVAYFTVDGNDIYTEVE